MPNNLLKDFVEFHDKKVIFTYYFNFILNKGFEYVGGLPFSKNIV